MLRVVSFSPARTVGGFCLLILCVVAGCSSSSSAPPELPSSIVTGLVSLDGKPVIGAQVVFVPIEDTKGFGGSTITDASGNYTIDKTALPGAAGIPEGKYKVTVAPVHIPEDPTLAAEFNVPPGAVKSLPKSYAAPESSPLETVVVAGGGPVNLELKSTGR